MSRRWLSGCARRVVLLAALAAGSSGPLAANDLHPDVPLLDANGRLVLLSGRALSTMQTCGACHDAVFIESSSDHADAGAAQLGSGAARHPWGAGPGYYGSWDPLRYDLATDARDVLDPLRWLRHFGSRHVGGGPVADWVEMDCLMCHSDITDPQWRERALAEGDFAWANSARLAARGIVVQEAGGRSWNPFMFRADGSLLDGLLEIRKPRSENCAQCHGQVATGLDEPLTITPEIGRRSMTDRSGQIISPQKLNNTGLNLAGKETLTHALDVHADRVLGCVSCHYSLNNPVYYEEDPASRPAHLAFDPRRLTSSDYLTRPLHQFAKGHSPYGLAAFGSENSLRRCESCHDATAVHGWLPYRARHFEALACEACHVPKLYGPALQMLDWTLVDRDGRPQRHYRGVEGDPSSADSLIHGFRPALLPRHNVGREGERKLAPFNLVSAWYWLAGDPPQPVARETLRAALYPNDSLHSDVLRDLDTDGDGRLQGAEWRLDTPERAEVVRRRLQQEGLTGVQLAAEATPFPISHNVVNGQWATRACRHCHGADSILAAAFPLADYLPGGIQPALSVSPGGSLGGGAGPAPASVIAAVGEGASLRPQPGREGYYILGLDAVPWVDLAGLVMFFGIVAGTTVHAVARFLARRRRPPAHWQPTRRVRMYDAYDRLWHWLQASAILLLIATGLIIHKPHLFGMFSFAYVVQVHNVLGFVLLINAALALFYTVASGTIRRFLPEPRDFFGRAVAQAAYYTRGIFAGEPHPLERTRDNRLNPLQQITYLAILNVLLPAQVLTGVLIWGAQRWPQLSAALGGLPVLAPLHTLLAWAFAAFIVMHVYLTTTAGETPGAGIRAMVSGWEEVETERAADP
ncbi:MAG: cytochrome b/b6 domain-containing protein [Xanthomonadales bacterium]|nr:cytochrome b/b6 domain-containing protein [Xanthomonadales bacterium]